MIFAGILDLFGEPQRPPVRDRDQDRGVTDAQSLINETVAAKVSGIGFTEVMSGYIHIGRHLSSDRKEDFEVAARTARGLCESARFFLSVKAWNTETSTYSHETYAA